MALNSTNTPSRLSFIVVLLAAAAFPSGFLAGCGDDDEEIVVIPENARIRALHLSPDAPAVDIYVNGTTKAVDSLAFPDGTDYLDLRPGTYTFNVTPAGSPAGDSVLDIVGLSLLAGESYTAVAYDELASIQALALVDDLSGLAAGQIRVRAIHTAVGVGQVDIWNIPQAGAPAPLYTDFDFGEVGDYFDLPAGAYTLGLDINNDANPDLIFGLPALAAGTVANIFAVKDGDRVFLLAQLQDGTTVSINPFSYIRVLHLSPDAPAVDVYVNDSIKAVSSLEFPDGTGFLNLESGTYDFSVTAAGAPPADAVLTIDDLALEAGNRYTAVAYDFLATIKPLALVEDLSAPPAGQIRVRAIHAASGVGQVDIWNIPEAGPPALLYEDVDFGAVGDYLELTAGAYTLGLDVNNDAIPDLTFELPALPAGTIANVFAVNDGESVFLLAQFSDGTTARIDRLPAFIRVLHLSPDAPAVDVYVNETIKAVENLAFKAGTNFLTLDPGTYDFSVTATGTPEADRVLFIDDFELAAGARWTAVAFDQLAAIQALALEDDFSALDPGTIRVRAIHAAPGVGQVDIWNIPTDGSPAAPLYQDVDFGVAGGYLELPAGAYRIGFDVDNDAVPDLVFDLPSLAGGTVASVFAVNQGANVFLLAQLQTSAVVQIDPLAPCSDLDGDGYGSPASPLCDEPALDCDDSDAGINPGAPEIPGNGIDEDCSGADAPCSAFPVNTSNAAQLIPFFALYLLPAAFVLLVRRRVRLRTS